MISKISLPGHKLMELSHEQAREEKSQNHRGTKKHLTKSNTHSC